jgi:glycerol-3-phosphate dehydrogenase
MHPSDRRPLYALPWEGVTILGTTDVDHRADAETNPVTSSAEVEYLMEAATRIFPALELAPADVQATFAGLRAVVDTGQANPSKESREYVLWDENGLLTVSGGKLTTFRPMAHAALRAVRRRLPGHPGLNPRYRVLDALPADSTLCADFEPAARLRLFGRYGADICDLVNAARPDELKPIGTSPALWAELRWAARAEGVVHLDDLLLRRVRLGLLLPRGGLDWMERIHAVVQDELGWDDPRWTREVEEYAQLWERCYSTGTRGK